LNGLFCKMIFKTLFSAKKTPAWFVRMFAVLYGILWIISAVKFLPEYIYYWKHARGYAVLYTVLAIVLVLMVFWLFKLDKKGWTLLMFHFCYNVISITYSFFNTPTQNDIISYRRNPTDLLLPLFICGTLLYLFNRKDVLKTFQITPRFHLLTIMISAILVIVHIFLNRAGNNWNYYFG
jgi:hypothetical protein